MKLKNLPFLLLLTICTAMVVGCGDDDHHDSRLSKDDIAYLKRKRLEEMYGGGTTTTTTNTQVQYVTITAVNTVFQTQNAQ